MENRKNLIIGAGISGIGAAVANKEKNPIIIEKNNVFGGLCGNFTVDGYMFDYGPHFSFTNNDVVKSIFDKTDYYAYNPYPVNYYNSIWIKHPVQNNLYPLKVEQKIKVIKSFIDREIGIEPQNYYEWLKLQYGTYFTDEFPAKYTRKYWCKNPHELSINWVGERMYTPTIEEVLYGAMENETSNTYYAKEMRYPKNGGYKSFLKSILNDVNIQYNKSIVKINIINKSVELNDGEVIKYKNLVSSLPLPEILKLIGDDVPEDVITAGNKLLASSVCLISVGFNKKVEFPSTWFYIYDENIPYARAHSPNLKADNNVPFEKSSLQFEIYYTHEKPLKYNEDSLRKIVLDDLEKMRIAAKEDILFIDIRYVKYANVIFYVGMEEDRNTVLDYLSKINIKSVGRFGKWDYLWSDQSFLSGYVVNMD